MPKKVGRGRGAFGGSPGCREQGLAGKSRKTEKGGEPEKINPDRYPNDIIKHPFNFFTCYVMDLSFEPSFKKQIDWLTLRGNGRLEPYSPIILMTDFFETLNGMRRMK